MRSRGFSLIELLVVVAVVLIIAAIAIPNMMRARMNANEASAVSSVRAVNTAQSTYAISYPNAGYADSLTKLGAPGGGGPPDANHAAILDWVLGCAAQPCPKSGYNFSVVNAVGIPVTSYEIRAVPIIYNQSGTRGFCSDSLIVIKADPAGGTNCTVMVE